MNIEEWKIASEEERAGLDDDSYLKLIEETIGDPNRLADVWSRTDRDRQEKMFSTLVEKVEQIDDEESLRRAVRLVANTKKDVQIEHKDFCENVVERAMDEKDNDETVFAWITLHPEIQKENAHLLPKIKEQVKDDPELLGALEDENETVMPSKVTIEELKENDGMVTSHERKDYLRTFGKDIGNDSIEQKDEKPESR